MGLATVAYARSSRRVRRTLRQALVPHGSGRRTGTLHVVAGAAALNNDEDFSVALPLEMSLPHVTAIADVLAGSTKRVASAVGEGSMAIAFVHQHLAHEKSRRGG